MIQTYRANRSKVRRVPLELRALAIDHQQEPVSRPNGIQIHQWRLCTDGEGELILGEKRFLLEAGVGFLLWAHTPHIYRGTGDFRMDAVGFGGAAAPIILQSVNLPESGAYRFADPAAFRNSLKALNTLQGTMGEHVLDRVSTHLYGLLLQTARSTRTVRLQLPKQVNFHSGFVPEMISYMEENWAQPLSLDDMSERFGRSKEYICSAFRREVGINFVDFLTRIRIFHVRTLLLDYPEMKIAEIAERCGFSSASYFGMVFRKDVGVSPGLYRLTESREP